METADFEMPIFLAASVKPPWSTTVAKASISVRRSMVAPLQVRRLGADTDDKSGTIADCRDDKSGDFHGIGERAGNGTCRAGPRAAPVQSAAASRVPWSMARLASSSAATSAPPMTWTAWPRAIERVGQRPLALLPAQRTTVSAGIRTDSPASPSRTQRPSCVDPLVGDAPQHPHAPHRRARRGGSSPWSVPSPVPGVLGPALEQRHLAQRRRRAGARRARGRRA